MKPLQVVIAEEIPSRNKGEAAILFGIRESLDRAGDCDLSLISRYPEDAVYNDSATVVLDEFLSSRHSALSLALQSARLVGVGLAEAVLGATWLGKRKLRPAHRALVEADVLFVGHDNVFAKDINLRCAPIMIYAGITRKPVVSYGASIGPFTSGGLKRFLLRHLVLRRLSLVTLREARSEEYALAEGISADRLHVAADLAFLLEPDPAGAERARSISGEGPVVAVTTTRLLLDHVRTIDGEPHGESPGDYEARYRAMARFLDLVVERHGVRILLVAHAIGPQSRHDDRPVNQAVVERMERSESVDLQNDDLSAAELKGLFGQVDLLIGMRTHSLIAATGMCTPVMALTAEGRLKTSGIIGDQLRLTESLTYVEDFSPTRLADRFGELWAERSRLREVLESSLPEVRRNAEQNGRILLSSVQRRPPSRDQH